tara:strand:+ start:41 stop:622 length:582 start_codon:yes stop_codon:yes gene_type:complete
MKKLLSLFAILALVSACSAKQEEPAIAETGFHDVVQDKPVAIKPAKKAPVVKKQVKKPAPVLEYKQDEKEMIEELKERFKEINQDKEDVIIIEQEPETVEFSEPVNFTTAEDEGLKVLETLAKEDEKKDKALEQTQEQKVQTQQAISLSDSIAVEEKDSFKEEQNLEHAKKLFLSIFIVLFLIACLVIGLKKK